DRFDPPTLRAGGFSPLVTAIRRTLELIDVRRDALDRQGGGLVHPPLVVVLTDGAPSNESGAPPDSWRDLAVDLPQRGRAGRLLVFALGVRGANSEVLTGLAPAGHFQIETTDVTTLLERMLMDIGTATVHSGIRTPSELCEEQTLAWRS